MISSSADNEFNVIAVFSLLSYKNGISLSNLNASEEIGIQHFATGWRPSSSVLR